MLRLKELISELETASRISVSNNRLKGSAMELTETTEKAKETVEEQVVEVYKIIEMVDNESRTSNHTIQSIDYL